MKSILNSIRFKVCKTDNKYLTEYCMSTMYADCGPAAGCFFRKVEIGDHHFKVIYDDNDQEDFTMYIYVG